MSEGARYEVEPDPALDGADELDGVFVVELTWVPDALAGRLDELVASPQLVAALTQAGISGFTTGAARGWYDDENSFVDEGTPPPELVRLVVGSDPDADMSLRGPRGFQLYVSEAALAVLQQHCQSLGVEPASTPGA